MQRAWRIFVAAAVFALMLAPKIAFCLSQNQPDHACCAPETKLSTQPCCPNAAPQIPSTNTAQADWQSEFRASVAIFKFTKVEPLSLHPIARASALPNQPPNTILRT